MISVSAPLYWDNLVYGFDSDLFSFAYVLTHKCKDELDGACSMCGSNEKCIKNFAWNI
jgi:hypothetical protein